MLGAFLLAAPYSLLDLPEFLNSFAFLAQHYNSPRPALEVADQYVSYIRNAFSVGAGGWWNMLGWPALWLALAGLVWLAAQMRSGVHRAGARCRARVSDRVFLDDQPSIAGVRQICAAARAGALPWDRRSPLPGCGHGFAWPPAYSVALVLIAIPPTVQAMSFDLAHGKVGTEELVARWLEHNVPPGDRIFIETPRIRLRPEFPFEYTPRLIHESLESYQEHGVKYLVASSEKFNTATAGRDMSPETPHRTSVSFPRLSSCRRSSGRPDHPGPNFTIFSKCPAQDSIGRGSGRPRALANACALPQRGDPARQGRPGGWRSARRDRPAREVRHASSPATRRRSCPRARAGRARWRLARDRPAIAALSHRSASLLGSAAGVRLRSDRMSRRLTSASTYASSVSFATFTSFSMRAWRTSSCVMISPPNRTRT